MRRGLRMRHRAQSDASIARGDGGGARMLAELAKLVVEHASHAPAPGLGVLTR